MTLLNKALDMTRTLLDLAERGEWQEFERVQVKREAAIKMILTDLALTDLSPEKLPKYLKDDVRSLQAMNLRLLEKATPEMKKVMAEIATLKKNNKANSVYKEMR